MKFSSSLKFNYQLEKQQHSMAPYCDAEANERSALIQSSSDAIFKLLLDMQLDKIILFYENQEKELLDELEEVGKRRFSCKKRQGWKGIIMWRTWMTMTASPRMSHEAIF
ncbi:hypothetical protein C8J56DRAFT_1130189 [Mycena floridula]|nr:hypothetical protein C8J56DRAFT_1130189 [Mycena floridula]